MKLKIKKTNNVTKKKILKVIAVVVGVFVLVCLISIIPGKKVYSEAMAGKDSFVFAQAALGEQNFAETALNLNEAQAHFEKASKSMKWLKWMRIIPGVSRQIKAVDHLLKAGINMADGVEDISLLGEEVVSIVKVEGQDDISFDSIGKKKKQEVLKKLHESPEIIEIATQKLELAMIDINEIPEKGLLPPLKKAIAPIEDNKPMIEEFIEIAKPVVEVLPIVAGYPEEVTYLFLLQNNTELRATGGFIGTYGILKLEAADINSFETDNIYNLDNQAKEYLFIPPPEPFNKYIGSTQWFLRDANWNPDFGITAKKAEEFYHLENGPEQNINGIISVTPSLIQDLIELTGPIEVDGDTFTSENFVDKLQHQVEFGYLEEGISDAARKDMIGDMASILMGRITSLPKSQWVDLWSLVSKNSHQKQVLLYMKDENSQKYVKDLGWDGEVKDKLYTGRDFAMVIDTNLAALKTDKVMDRDYDYTVNKEGDDIIATLKMTYKNNGTFSNTTTRYRTYTRIYVPKGSELISSDGFYTNDKLNAGTPIAAFVKQDEELNKTVFEGFISIEPQDEEVITLTYKLPAEIVELINNDNYELYWQKQSGTMDNGLNVTLDFGHKAKELTALDLNVEKDNNKVQLNGELLTDKQIKISF